MHELYFLGMDIVEETRETNKFLTLLCTDGMTESELKAYNLGVENVLSTLKSVINEGNNMVVINIDGVCVPIELTIDELQEYYLTM